MIIDCHAHVFQNWHGACGHPSIDVHLKYIQKNLTRPAAEAFRVRDGKRVNTAMLFRSGDNTWAGLNDVGFRVGRYGRLEFMHEGEEHAIQYMPVGMQTICSPPEFMIAQMLYAGVDHCIIVVPHPNLHARTLLRGVERERCLGSRHSGRLGGDGLIIVHRHSSVERKDRLGCELADLRR